MWAGNRNFFPCHPADAPLPAFKKRLDFGGYCMNSRLGQPGLPRGIIGRIVGRIMRSHNRLDNEWTLSLLEIGAGERVLEVGFGPGDAITLAAASSPSSSITGVDHSPEMLAAAERLNREAIAEGCAAHARFRRGVAVRGRFVRQGICNQLHLLLGLARARIE